MPINHNKVNNEPDDGVSEVQPSHWNDVHTLPDHDELGNIGTDDHHDKQHAIDDSAHHTGVLTDAQIPSTIARDSEVTAAIAAHEGAGNPHSGYATDGDLSDHVAASDPHTGYRKESDDHTHESTGAQGGKLDHGNALNGLTDDDHTQYLKEKANGGTAAEVPEHTHASAAQGGFGSNRSTLWEIADRFVIGAHRGDINPNDGYPENTTRSLIEACLKGAHGVEFDVRLSSDSVFVLMHDDTVNRTTNGSFSVSAQTAATITALNIDGGYGYRVAHAGLYHPPTLAEVLVELKPYDVILFIEFKDPTLAGSTALAQQVVAAGWTERVVINIGTSSQTYAAAVKAVDPRIVVQGDPAWTESDFGYNYSYTSIPSLATVLVNAPKPSWVYSPIEDYGADQAARLRAVFNIGARGFGTDNLNEAMPEWYNIQSALKVALAGSDVGTQPKVNFIEGTGIELTVTDNTANERVDVTIASVPVGQYRQFVYEVSGGDFTFITDGDGNPVMALEDLE